MYNIIWYNYVCLLASSYSKIDCVLDDLMGREPILGSHSYSSISCIIYIYQHIIIWIEKSTHCLPSLLYVYCICISSTLQLYEEGDQYFGEECLFSLSCLSWASMSETDFESSDKSITKDHILQFHVIYSHIS